MVGFLVNETVLIEARVLEKVTEQPIDADKAYVTIKLRGVTKVDNQNMLKVSKGVFQYNYKPNEIGNYQAIVKVERGPLALIEKSYFAVIK